MTGNQVVVFVGGWGDMKVCYDDLISRLQSEFDNLVRFPFNFGRKFLEFKKFTQIEVLSRRLYEFLEKKSLLEPSIELNFVGYSLGGMVIYYCLGLNPKILQKTKKIISIATPHNGAFIDELKNLIKTTLDKTKGFLLSRGGIFGTLCAAFLELSENLSGADQMLRDKNSLFLREKYPNVCIRVFKQIDRSKILEIYSPYDPVAPEESTTRFKEFMTIFKVSSLNHQSIANKPEVRDKVFYWLL